MRPHPVERVVRIVDGYGEVMCHGEQDESQPQATITGSDRVAFFGCTLLHSFRLDPQSSISSVRN